MVKNSLHSLRMSSEGWFAPWRNWFILTLTDKNFIANKLERQSLFSWEQAVSDPLDRQEARTKMKNWKIWGSASQVGEKQPQKSKAFCFVIFIVVIRDSFFTGFIGVYFNDDMVQEPTILLLLLLFLFYLFMAIRGASRKVHIHFIRFLCSGLRAVSM